MMRKNIYPYMTYFALFLFFVTSVVGHNIWEKKFGSISTEAIKGEIILDSHDLNSSIYALNGEWGFYPNELVTPGIFKQKSKNHIEVPSDWKNEFKHNKPPTYGYGTYRLKINVPREERRLAIHIVSIHSASRVYIDSKLYYELGSVGENIKNSKPKNIPQTVIFEKTRGQEVIDLTIQVSNFSDIRSGGIVRDVMFGDADILIKNLNVSHSVEIVILTTLFLTAFLLLSLFICVNRTKELLYVSLIVFNFTLLFTTGMGGKLLHHWIDLSYEMNTRIVNISVILISILFLLLIINQFSEKNRAKVVWLIRIQLIVLSACLIIPIWEIHYLYYLLVAFLTISFLFMFVITNRRIERGSVVQILFLLSLVSLSMHLVVWFYSYFTGDVYIFYPFDLMISLFCLIFTWLKHYQGLYKKMEEINHDLIDAIESKNNFLSRVAVKLRKPIKEMDNLLNSMMQGEIFVKNEELTENISLVNEANQDMLMLVNNMEELSNSEFSLKKDFVEPLSMKKKIDYCVSTISQNEIYRSIIMKDQIAEEISFVYGNTRHFVQLIFQLIFVSKKLIPSGELTFSSEDIGNQRLLYVTYKDCFVSKEQVSIMNLSLHELLEDDTLFESIYGIEMSLLHSLTRLQGGRLIVEQLPNGLKMIFYFDKANELIIHEETLFITKNERLETEEYKKIILIISSDLKLMETLKLLLESKETLVITTAQIKKALDYIDIYDFDLVISDTILEESTGFNFVKQIRKLHTMIQLPVLLIVSTKKYRVELNEVYRSGANDYIEKPIDTVELIARAKMLIEMKQNIDQAIHYEASWLQAQIEPHFLFNTLNTIISLSCQDEEKMEEVFDAFMSLLHSKYHYDNEGKITLEEELELVKSYLLIEKTRYGDKLEIIWDIDETIDLTTIEIIPLSIQPIVENAIKHGILPQKSTGVLTVRVKKNSDNKVIVDIEDDGNGIDRTMNDFLQMRYDKLPVGIGLTNTYYRFKKIMGKELLFQSELGQGTKVSFCLEYQE